MGKKEEGEYQYLFPIYLLVLGTYYVYTYLHVKFIYLLPSGIRFFPQSKHLENIPGDHMIFVAKIINGKMVEQKCDSELCGVI